MLRGIQRGQPFGSESWRTEKRRGWVWSGCSDPEADHENNLTTTPDPFSRFTLLPDWEGGTGPKDESGKAKAATS